MDIIMSQPLLSQPLLSQPLLSTQFEKSLVSFDLIKQNHFLGVIKFPVAYHADDFNKLIDKIVAKESLIHNYYEIQCMLNQIVSTDRFYVVNKISNALSTILKAANNSLKKSSKGSVTISEFNQIYKYYHDIGEEFYRLLSVYQKNLVKLYSLPGGRITNILDTMEKTTFFNDFIKISDTDIIQIENNITHIDYHNVEQLIYFIQSINHCIPTNSDGRNSSGHIQKITENIKKILNNIKTVDCLNAYFHNIMTSKNNTKTLVNTIDEYSTINVAKIVKNLNKKKYSLLNIFMRYCNKTILYLCYTKYLKIRILNSNYGNLELEISNVNALSNTFGKINAQKLLDMISNILNSRKITEIIHASTITIKTDQYNNLQFASSIVASVVKPIILDNSIWNIQCSNIDLIFPPELNAYLDIVSKTHDIYTRNQRIIRWQGLLGTATFSAILGNNKVVIECNTLQAIALSHLNSNNKISINKFAISSRMGIKLAEKVINSLFETNLIISNANEKSYIINTNYTGDDIVDLVKAFRDSFIESDHKVED